MDNENLNQENNNVQVSKKNPIKFIVIALVSFFGGFILFFIITTIITVYRVENNGSDVGTIYSVLSTIRILVPFIMCLVIAPISLIKGIIGLNKKNQ